jgi:circadian clock protein KaiC
VPAWELDGRWTFIEATPGPEDRATVVGGHFDLTVLLNGITDAVERTGAQRVAIDSLNVLFARFEDSAAVRDGLVRITSRLERLGVTALMTIAREESDHSPRWASVRRGQPGHLRNELEERPGGSYRCSSSAHPTRQASSVRSPRRQAMVVIPQRQLDQPSRLHRSGTPAHDEMCGGGRRHVSGPAR